VLPQTSTIASHLPKAVGTALALGRARKIGVLPPVPPDSIVLCSFGDASTNHKSALGAFNMASWTHFQKLPVPILFVCEDNGIGISVKSPPGYIEREFATAQPGLYRADRTDSSGPRVRRRAASEHCRARRAPSSCTSNGAAARSRRHRCRARVPPVAEVEADEA
jgi:2-oxoisovalerate dehydrogenase E1 component